MKIKENFDYLLDESKPLIPQLRKVKRACFKPYVSDLQMIRWNCEQCSEEGIYSKCDFYEATHLDCFGQHREEIMTNNTIHKPKSFHPEAERMCYGRISLEKILKGAWPLIEYERTEPRWLGTEEHRKWAEHKKELQKDLPCKNGCKLDLWCPFYQNDFERKLCLTTIKEWDDDEVYFNLKYSDKTDKGYRVDSYLYQTFIKPTKIGELPPIKTDFGFKKLDEWQYTVYEKVYHGIAGQKKRSVVLLKAVLEELVNEKDEEGFLKKVSYYGDFDYKKIRTFAQEHSADLSETCHQLVKVDLTFWREWVKRQYLEFSDVLYAWFLSEQKSPSRKEIEEKFKIKQREQIAIEKRLGVRKDFRGIVGEKQFTNNYLTNPYVIGAIFKVLDKEQTKEKLTEVAERNKEKIAEVAKRKKEKERRKKFYDKDGQPKLSQKQLEELDKLKQQTQITKN